MKKWVAVSLFLHALFFVTVAVKSAKQESGNPPGQKSKGGTNQNIDIIENSPMLGSKPKDDRKFYWGLGIHVDFKSYSYLGSTITSFVITKVVAGYSADSSGLLTGDIVILINGSPLSPENSVEGPGPRKMILTILRNGVTVRVQTERVKVYY